MQSLSLHRVMTLTVLGLGALGVLLVLGAGMTYRELAYEHKSAALRQLIRINAGIVLEDTYEVAAELGHSVHAAKLDHRVLTGPERATLVNELDQHFHRYFVTSNLLSLKQLHVLNADYETVVSSSGVDDSVGRAPEYCPSALHAARGRTGADRLQSVTALCSVDHEPIVTVIVPLGGLRPSGYLAVVADPLVNLAKLEPILGSPIQIRADDDRILFRSDRWPADDARDHILISRHDLTETSGVQPALYIEAAADVTTFNTQLAKALYAVFACSVVLVLAGLAVAMRVLRGGVTDLHQLQDAAEALAEGRYKTLHNAQYPEIRALTKSFNRMSLQMRMHHEHLNELVTIRTRELEIANAKLGADMDRQRELDRMKDEFIAMINHEMRTPVTAIKGALDLIGCGKLGQVPPELQSLVAIGRGNCDRLLRLINDVLNIQQLEEGTFTFDLQRMPLAPIVKCAVETTQPFADSYNVKFKLFDNFPGAYVRLDRDRALQVFTNLLSNAAKYTRPGDEVEVLLDQHRNFARVAVIDHGPGIPDSFRDKVFSKFSQANVSNTRPTGSSGLGLYVTKRLVGGMNGSIDFETEEERGTAFFVDFPVVPPPGATVEKLGAEAAVELEGQE